MMPLRSFPLFLSHSLCLTKTRCTLTFSPTTSPLHPSLPHDTFTKPILHCLQPRLAPSCQQLSISRNLYRSTCVLVQVALLRMRHAWKMQSHSLKRRSIQQLQQRLETLQGHFKSPPITCADVQTLALAHDVQLVSTLPNMFLLASGAAQQHCTDV